jgi:hypothetical protein
MSFINVAKHIISELHTIDLLVGRCSPSSVGVLVSSDAWCVMLMEGLGFLNMRDSNWVV